MGICHLCGGRVSSTNDKGILLARVNGTGIDAYLSKPQHVIPGFYPGAGAPCVGSPSIAQYLPGQRPDTREGPDGCLRYPIQANMIERVRKAWGDMQLGVGMNWQREYPPASRW